VTASKSTSAGQSIFGLLAVALVAFLIGRGVTLRASAYTDTQRVYWAEFSTSCHGCQPIASVRAWATGSMAAPHPWSVIMASPGCSSGSVFEDAATWSSSGGDYYVDVGLDAGTAFCSSTVDWRVAWEHV
jgi:hypothetical protein